MCPYLKILEFSARLQVGLVVVSEDTARYPIHNVIVRLCFDYTCAFKVI